MKLAHTNKKIIAVDFDGTLVHNEYPFISNPNMELIDFIKKNRRKYVWILWTCRQGKQLDFALEYLQREHGIKFDYVNQNVSWNIKKFADCRKVYADYYIDEHSLTTEQLLKGEL